MRHWYAIYAAGHFFRRGMGKTVRETDVASARVRQAGSRREGGVVSNE